jgi:predicted lysophospholipase L1 biosynthesis ABC-type transport system permease subunit
VELRRYAATGDPAPATEWWFALSPGSEAAVVEQLRAPPFSPDEVVAREELTRSLTADPVPLGVVGALGLGSIAAMVFAAIAFLVSATVSTSERIGEFAILRALGLSLRQLSTWLTFENAFLLAFGLVTGSGIGLLLAWLVLPFATLTSSGEAAVPPPTVVVPLEALVPMYALGLGLLLVTVVVIGRQLPQVRITDVLRGRDE